MSIPKTVIFLLYKNSEEYFQQYNFCGLVTFTEEILNGKLHILCSAPPGNKVRIYMNPSVSK